MTEALELWVSVEAPDWATRLPGVEELCHRAALAAFAAAGPAGPAEASVVLTDDAAIKELNRDWRGRDEATNVLSFAAQEGGGPKPPPGAPVMLGDVVVALETLIREAEEEGKSFSDHFCHLVVHGMLHLMGHDHQTDTDAASMEGLEVRILAGLGIADPYRDRDIQP